MSVTGTRYDWIDCLRSTITILVVGHHSALAYTTFANFATVRYIDSTHPIVDSQRSPALDIFQNFNDIFFMSLMFFIGGLFLHKSILKKGVANFVKDRLYRLFLPFILLGTVLMLIAHIPAYYSAHHSFGLVSYIVDFFGNERWPVGPPWFLWVLFVFNVIFALASNALRTVMVPAAVLTRLAKRPFLVIALLIAGTWLLYVPVALMVGPGTWTGIGPFDFQLSRIVLYFGYFIIGAQIGYGDIHSTLFNKRAQLVGTWKLLVASALSIYGLLTALGYWKVLEQLVLNGYLNVHAAWMIYFALYVTSCSVSCLAFISFFRATVETKNTVWNSLSDNAYLIYLVHYVFVIWIQYGLTGVTMHPIAKFLLVFISSFALSWLTSIMLRKNKLIAQYL